MSAIATPQAVALSFAGQCDRGKVRDENQDCVRQCTTPLGELLLVADGISGYEGGGVASRMAIDVIAASFDSIPAFFPVDIAIEEAICRANAEIVAAGAEPDSPNSRMGTTVVAALLQQDPENAHAPIRAWIGHVGDSRAYRLHHGRLTQITRDHSATQLLLDQNLIAPEEARNHPDASVLTRTLGHESIVKVDLNSVELEPGDTLLLCSDGLWGYISDEQIERTLADPALTAEQASRSLLDLALEAGGHDNVGIQIARLAGNSAAAVARQPAAADASPSEPEPLLSYLFTRRLPEPSAASWAEPETAIRSEAEAAPLEIIPAPAAPLTILLAPEPEIASSPAAEPPLARATDMETAAQPSAEVEPEPVFRLEPLLELPQTEEETPSRPDGRVSETEIDEDQTLSLPFDPQFIEWQPVPLSALNTESVLQLGKPEPRSTTILGIAASLWEQFVHPLGRDFDFAPEWHTDFASWYGSAQREEGEPRLPRAALPTLLAAFLVRCAAAPRRGIASLPGQTLDLHSRFKGSTSEVSTLLKYLGLLLLAFCFSCGLVYFALFQNWFGIDQILHLL
jgi:PPM family protein phosphatase